MVDPAPVTQAPSPVRPVVRIEASRGFVGLRLREVWAYRELLFFLTWRDIKVRYKQTILGAAWAVIQPVTNMVVFSIFFGRLAKVPSDGQPYPMFSMVGLVPWMLFASGLGAASNSLVGSANLIKKIYFPRLVIPLAAVAVPVVDFCLGFLVLIALMVAYASSGQPIQLSWAVLWVVPMSILAMVTSLGVGLWLSALNVQYRDVRYVVPFLIQIWMFATPVAYPASLVPEKWRVLYACNPMVGVVEGFRWALLGSGQAPGPSTLVSAATALVLLVGGAVTFRRMERHFADVV